MRAVLNFACHPPILTSFAFSTLLTTVTCAQGACPDYVTLPSQTAFNIAQLIADVGSPEAAAAKIRSAIARVKAAGGCPRSAQLAGCEETLAVANKALEELDRCIMAGRSSGVVRKAGRVSE